MQDPLFLIVSFANSEKKLLQCAAPGCSVKADATPQNEAGGPTTSP